MLAARANLESADTAFKQSVVDALKAGASVREIQLALGLSAPTIVKWGHAGGWPTPEQRAGWIDGHHRQPDLERQVQAAAKVADYVLGKPPKKKT